MKLPATARTDANKLPALFKEFLGKIFGNKK